MCIYLGRWKEGQKLIFLSKVGGSRKGILWSECNELIFENDGEEP